MASRNHPYRPLSYYDPEADLDDNSDRQHWQDEDMYAVANSAYANRRFEAEAFSPGTASLLDAQNNRSSTTAKVIGDGFAAPLMNINGYLDSFGISGSILPPNGPLVLPENPLDGWRCLSSSTALPSTLHLPSVPNTYDPLVLNHNTMIQCPNFDTLSNDVAHNIGSSTYANDDLFLVQEESYAIPSGNDYGHTMNHEFFENCMADLQHNASNSLSHLGMTTHHPLSSTSRPDMALSSHDAGLSIAVGQGWNVEFQPNETEATMLSSPSYHQSNTQSHIPDSSFLSGRLSSSSTPQVSNTMGTNKSVNIPLKSRQLLPKLKNSNSETIEIDCGIHTSVKATKKPGRKGKLPENRKAKILKMRQTKACASCFASHVECSEGDPCVRCANSPYLGIPCSRDSLGLYLEGLVPPFLGQHLVQDVVGNFTNSLKFMNNEIIVELSTGPSHPPIKLLVCEFLPADKNILDVPDSTPKSRYNVQSFPNVQSLAWGILKRNTDQLKPKCLEHIQMISNLDTVIGEHNTLSWKIMRAICCFQQEDQIAQTNDLLIKAIRVNRLHYVLGTNIFFSQASVDTAISSLQAGATDLPCRSRVSSRVLTKQIKGVMNDMLNDLTKELLEQYNGELRAKSPQTWLLCLMTHLILCICAEDIQTQVDSFIVFRISKGACDPSTVRKCGTEVCRRVEHLVLEHSWVLIRGKLRTLLTKRNPFKYGYQVAEDQVPKETELNLINEIRQVMSDHSNSVLVEDDTYANSLQRRKYSKRQATATTAAPPERQVIPTHFGKVTQAGCCQSFSGGFIDEVKRRLGPKRGNGYTKERKYPPKLIRGNIMSRDIQARGSEKISHVESKLRPRAS